MRVLVTGGAGFIGSHLVEHHLGLGDRVHAVDDLSTGSLENLQPVLDDTRFRFDEADILSWDGLDEAASRADRVYHMAAVVGMLRALSEPVAVMAINVAGTERLLRAVHSGGRRPRVLLASSSEVYGPRENDRLREDSDLVLRSGAVSRWNYSLSKLAAEALALSYVSKLDLHVTVARLFNTIGPRQSGRYGMVVPRFVRQAARGEPITVFGDGSQSRCFCDVRDAVSALVGLLATEACKGEIVNVGGDREVTILELAEMIRRRAASASPIERQTYREAYGADYEDVPRRKPHLGKLSVLTGFRHRYSLEETLDQLLAAQRPSPTQTPTLR